MIKYLIHLTLGLVLFTVGPGEIAKINRLKREAEEAYKQGNFELALEKYTYLTDSLAVDDPNALLNKAHCLYHLQDTAAAKLAYNAVAGSAPKATQSIAWQQLGVMAKTPQSLQQSLQYLKASLKADPTNTDARYDYEVVKKLLDQQQQNQENQQNRQQEQENKEEENQEQQNQENQEQESQKQTESGQGNGEQNENEQPGQTDKKERDGEQQQEQTEQQKPAEEQQGEPQNEGQSVREKLKEMNISEEKAKMILEALRNNEIQYIQQQKRKAAKRPESGKPDW